MCSKLYRRFKSTCFNMLTGINELKILQYINHYNVNVNLVVEHVNQIKSKITININSSAKNIIHVNNIIFGILIYVVAKMINIH